MADKLSFLAICFAEASVYSSLGLLAMLVFAKHRRLGVITGALGFGPVLFRLRVFGVAIRVKLVPLTGFIVPYPTPHVGREHEDAASAIAARVAKKELRAYHELGLVERIAFVSLNPGIALGFAMAALGPRSFARIALGDLWLVARGVVGPLSTAHSALDSALAHFRATGSIGALVRFTGVLLALQAFAVGSLQFLWRDRTAKPAKVLTGVALAGFLASIVVTGMWLLASITWLGR